MIIVSNNLYNNYTLLSVFLTLLSELSKYVKLKWEMVCFDVNHIHLIELYSTVHAALCMTLTHLSTVITCMFTSEIIKVNSGCLSHTKNMLTRLHVEAALGDDIHEFFDNMTDMVLVLYQWKAALHFLRMLFHSSISFPLHSSSK